MFCFFLFFLALPSHNAWHARSFHISTFLLTVRGMLCVVTLIWPSLVSVVAHCWTEAVHLPHMWHHRRGPLLLLQLLPRHFERRCWQKRLHCGRKSTHALAFHTIPDNILWRVLSNNSVCVGHQRAESWLAHRTHAHPGLHHFQEVVQPPLWAPPLSVPARFWHGYLQDFQQAGGTFILSCSCDPYDFRFYTVAKYS